MNQHWSSGAAVPKSLAVLYFRNPGGSKDDEYFCDGVTEDIIIELSRISGLSMIPISSVRPFRGTKTSAVEAGEQLHASFVLEGSLRRSKNNLSLSVQLVETQSGHTAWAERYNRQVEDVFAIQEEIAQNIVNELRVVMTEEEKRTIAKVPTTKVEAYDQYLKGRQVFRQFRRKSIESACDIFKKAIEIDPRYAGAYAGLSDCYSYLYMFWESRPEYLEEADRASRKAIELGQELAEAHVARGVAASLDKNFDEADDAFRTAIRLNPSLWEAHYFYARGYYARGKLDRAIYWFRRACEVRPEDYQAPTLLASALKGLGLRRESEAAYRQAAELARKHLDLFPGTTRALYFGAISLSQIGQDKKQALEWAERALAMDPEEPQVLYNVGCFYALEGMIEKSLDCLAKTIAHGDWWRGWMKNDPDLESLHEHPEFKRLVGPSA